MKQPHELKDYGFFVGYLKTMPRGIALFALAVGAALVGAAAASGLLLAYSSDNPLDRVYGPDTNVSGLYQAQPYPHIRTSPDKDHPSGHTLLLAGDGKRGAQSAGDAFAGQVVDVTGGLLKRGTIDMLIVDTIKASAGPAPQASAAVSLGRWRIGGEVCDGKCAAGAMKPGTGLAHKGCANLCIAGGLPPLLVTEKPVEGSNFLLLADAAGGPLATGTWENYVARPVMLEGEVERRGDVLVMKLAPGQAVFP